MRLSLHTNLQRSRMVWCWTERQIVLSELLFVLLLVRLRGRKKLAARLYCCSLSEMNVPRLLPALL